MQSRLRLFPILLLMLAVSLLACRQQAGQPPRPTIVEAQAAEVAAEPVRDSGPVSSPASLENISLDMVEVAAGFERPLYLTHAGDGTERLFIVTQAGQIFILDGETVLETPFLDIRDLVGDRANEQGLLSVAFHPDYENNGLFFVDYTDTNGDTVIARYQVSDDPNVADPARATTLLTIGQPYGNHNGGLLKFGPDGYLYVGTGDGGSGGDPQNNGQSLDTLLGKILRLDVDKAEPYGVPADNPFVEDETARPEIWAYGLRNPWRFSFDRLTGDKFIADVGQNQYEEVNFEPAETPGGLNYGWRIMEGKHCFKPDTGCDTSGLVLPIAEYGRSAGCSVTGGYVYRGASYPALTGVYLYGDYCTGTIWGLSRDESGAWVNTELLPEGEQTISSFGQDEAGELYVINHRGSVLRLVVN